MCDSWLRSGHGKRLASTDVELRAMPRTGNRVVVQLAFGQWPAVMCADIVESKELAVNLEKRHEAIINLDQHFAGIRQVGNAGDTDKVSHILGSMQWQIAKCKLQI